MGTTILGSETLLLRCTVWLFPSTDDGVRNMIRIAIVEDNANYQRQLLNFLHRYEEENGEQFRISVFTDGLDIVEANTASIDVILMDIQMQNMDGMKAAERIRMGDKNVIIIFISNLAQYALQGYKVEALDYVLKPVQYFAFSQTLQKAVRKINDSKAFYIYIMQDNTMVRLNTDSITYIESQDHKVTFHTQEKIIATRETLKNLEQKLKGRPFARCNNCYLVNLVYVETVKENSVTVAGEQLQISRPKRKAFMEALAAYVGGD